MMIRIQATRRNIEFILFRCWPVTEDTVEKVIEDGRSQWYASPFRQDPSYKDWRVEMCEYDLDEHGEPVNISVTSTQPIEEQS